MRAGQGLGQGVLAEERAGGLRGIELFAGLGRAVGVEQQGVAGRQAEPDVGELDVGGALCGCGQAGEVGAGLP